MSRRSRIGRSRRMLVATGASALLLVLPSCGEEGTTGGGPTPTRTGSPSTSTSASAPAGREAAVYFLTDTRTGFRLAREQRRVTGDRMAVAAVETMIAGPDDPDYASPWNPATRVLSVTRVGGDIVVDLSREARTANAGSEAAARMVQQLVYTVTEAIDRTAGVRLLIEGKPAGELWGILDWSTAVRREQPLDVRLLVQIDTPSQGERVASPVEVSGEAAAFEATVVWRVLDAGGEVVADGVARTTEGQRFAPYAFTVRPTPGTYVVEVAEDDASGGEGGTPMRDTRTFSVR